MHVFFRMDMSMLVNTLSQVKALAFNDMNPKSKQEEEEMEIVPYSIAIGKLVYVMVCTRPYYLMWWDLSRFRANLGKHHWEKVKRI